jgi:glycerate kinase
LVDVLNHYSSFKRKSLTVSDPLGRPVEATYLVSEDGRKAFIEMASASGLHLLKPEELNCSVTSTYGTGELIKDAIESGANKIILGIGGSATNDCGIGMASALGYRFLDGKGTELKPIGDNLIRINSIDSSDLISSNHVAVQVACDVTNALTGAEGATQVYGPQKGATSEMVRKLEAGMISFAKVIERELGMDVSSLKGGGAAGGMGAGCVAFLNADLISGLDLVFQFSNIERHIAEADLVITGEGKIDTQTLQGKLIWGITELCLKYNKPVIAICGTLAIGPEDLKKLNLNSAFSILSGPMTLEEATKNAYNLVADTAFQIARTLTLTQRIN